MTGAAAAPDPAWRGAERLGVICEVRSDRLGDESAERDFCARVARIAGEGALVAVEPLSRGELARNPDNMVALLVHATVTPAVVSVDGASGDLVAFTMRTMRTGAFAVEPAWFGAAPRVARRSDSPALDESIRASLAEVLPWRNSIKRLTPLERERES